MGSREDRIMNLASTLKASGLAKSEAQARIMAEEMIGVEENVQRKYDEEHAKAHEYLKTAKNLGDPRIKSQPQQEQKPKIEKPKIEPIGNRIQPVSNQERSHMMPPKVEVPESRINLSKPLDISAHEKHIELEEVHTDINFGKGTLKDLMLNQIQLDNHEIKTIEQLEEEAETKHEVTSVPKEENVIEQQSVNFPEKESVDETSVENSVEENSAVDEYVDKKSDDSSVNESDKENSSDEYAKIDGEKLREMMEEDGPMEEHTREIKEKPKEVKSKEEYIENTIDLGDVFNVNKK